MSRKSQLWMGGVLIVASAAQATAKPGPGAVPAEGCTVTETKVQIKPKTIVHDMIVADLTGDGKADIAAADDNGNIQVFINKGDGTFSGPTVYPAPNKKEWDVLLAAGDIDGDGHVDLVGGYRQSVDASTGIELLINKGNGTFKKAVDAKIPASDFANIRLADINGDHKVDIVADAKSDKPVLNGVVFIPNKGGGKFGMPVEISLAGRKDASNEISYRDKFTWELADVDGDGAPELVVTPRGIAHLVGDPDAFNGNFGACVLKIDKTAKFRSPACYSSIKGFEASVVAIADFNGDHKADLVVGPEPSSYMSEPFSVFINKGNGTFKDRVALDRGTVNDFEAIDARDVNGDGTADIVAIGTKSGGSTMEAEVFIGKGDGTFPTVVDVPIGYELNGNAPDVHVGDFLGGNSLGVAFSAYEGPETFIHVYSGRCAR